MTSDTTTYAVLNSPLVVALISVLATSLVALAVAAVKTLITLAQLQASVKAIQSDIQDLKLDPDVMRWSNYGRAMQAIQPTPPHQGVQP